MFTYAGLTTLPSLEAVLADISEPGAACFDFAAYYTEFELPEAARDYYCFWYEGSCYRMRVICTGQRHCPCLAQSLTETITDAVEADHPSIVAKAYIDNVRIAGEKVACAAATAMLFELCDTIGITIDQEEPWSEHYTFLGVVFNHEEKRVSVSPKSNTKLRALEKQFIASIDDPFAPPMTMHDMLRVFGSLIWSSRILGIELSNFYIPIKWLRRRAAAKCLLKDPADVWACAQPDLRAWLKACVQNEPRKMQAATRDDLAIVAYSDACLTGWGVTIFLTVAGTQTIFVASGVWGVAMQQSIIAILEGRAMLNCVNLLPQCGIVDVDPPAKLLMRIDNTSFEGAYHKGHSRHFIMNDIVRLCQQLLKSKNYSMTLEYVRSILNCADAPSRLNRVSCTMFSAPKN